MWTPIRHCRHDRHATERSYFSASRIILRGKIPKRGHGKRELAEHRVIHVYSKQQSKSDGTLRIDMHTHVIMPL